MPDQQPAGSRFHVLYHRRGGPTQTDDMARTILRTGRLAGTKGRYNVIPTVRAYLGPLPEPAWGIEFTTEVASDRFGVPGQPTWSGDRPGVTTEGELAWIEVWVTRIRFLDGTEYPFKGEVSDDN